MSVGSITPPPVDDLNRLLDLAIREDGDGCDVTSELLVPPEETGRYALVCRRQGVFAGSAVFAAFAARFVGDGLVVEPDVADGEAIEPGRILAVISGPSRIILRIERPLLNFLQRLCGVATLTRRFVDAVAGTSTRILDTRKTIPGWRQLDKYGVRCGGGVNHRIGLHDAVLVKDNHIAGIPVERLGQAVADLIERARRRRPPPDFIEIEVDSIDQLGEVLAVGGVDRVLLDNFTRDQMRRAVEMRDADPGCSVKLEASGGVDLATVADIAETGVDFISVGALTHSVECLDLALDAMPSE